MNLKEKYKDDIAFIMTKIDHNGGDLWATQDRKICKGSPFDTKDVALMLYELGFTKKDPIIQDMLTLYSVPGNQMDDSRFPLSEQSIPVIQLEQPGFCVIWDIQKMRGLKKLLSIYWKHNKRMVVGCVINSVSGKDRKQNIRIPVQHWKH